MADLFVVCLVAHLVADFCLQNDFLAQNKRTNTLICLLHVSIYTLAIMLCLLPQFIWWWIPAIFVPHFLIDRFGLARKYMWLIGQEAFATGQLAPWSIIVVDQVLHILCLFIIVRLTA